MQSVQVAHREGDASAAPAPAPAPGSSAARPSSSLSDVASSHWITDADRSAWTSAAEDENEDDGQDDDDDGDDDDDDDDANYPSTAGRRAMSVSVPMAAAAAAGFGHRYRSSRDATDYRRSSTNSPQARHYPGVQPQHQVERPYDSMVVQEAATIDSARSLYDSDIDYVVENGRQYCGEWYMPVDQAEQTRLYVMHQVYLKAFDLELTTVPLEDPHYILDIGTGIGEWAIGMAEKYPNCEVFGTDIAPIQPTDQVPFNVEFHIEDAEDEWIRPEDTVDLVHLRRLSGAFADWGFIYDQAFACIRPGGWIQVVDFDDLCGAANLSGSRPDDHDHDPDLDLDHDDSPSVIMWRSLQEAARAAGRPRDLAHLAPEALERAGFEDVAVETRELALDPGGFWMFALVSGIEAECMRPLTHHLGWDAADVSDLCDRVAREIKAAADDPARSRDSVVRLTSVTARKPLVRPASASSASLTMVRSAPAATGACDHHEHDECELCGEHHHHHHHCHHRNHEQQQHQLNHLARQLLGLPPPQPPLPPPLHEQGGAENSRPFDDHHSTDASTIRSRSEKTL